MSSAVLMLLPPGGSHLRCHHEALASDSVEQVPSEALTGAQGPRGHQAPPRSWELSRGSFSGSCSWDSLGTPRRGQGQGRANSHFPSGLQEGPPLGHQHG